MKKLLLMSIAALASTASFASSDDSDVKKYLPEVHGTVRAKYEYQTEKGEGRFQVRNARFSLTGNVLKAVAYKAEIDLSDEGSIKMLDAYTRVSPWINSGKDELRKTSFTIGQMRVPFTIDAHRSPHNQYFANRSFIAKQVGNVRDVGACLSYDFKVPVKIEAGIFNGSGIKEQHDWHTNVSYSVKLQTMIAKCWNVTLSTQRTQPASTGINMYDAGTYLNLGRWHIEAEYLFKHYADSKFKNVHAVNSFVNYDLPLQKVFNKISFLLRYDYMSDHWDGKTFNDESMPTITDNQRQRITAGITLSVGKAFLSDIRISGEKYFYRSGVTPNTSERDKIGIEFMTRF